MLTIWDSLFLSSFIPPNLWDNKKEDVNSSSPIFFLIILILPYWNSKWKCIYLVNFSCFSVVFQSFFRSFLLTRPYFIRICTFLSKTVVFSSIWKFLVLFHIIQFYHDSRVPFNCPFPYFLPFLLGILFRTFSVPFS